MWPKLSHTYTEEKISFHQKSWICARAPLHPSGEACLLKCSDMELNVNIAVAFKLWGNDDFFPHGGGSPAVAWVHWSCDLAEVKDPQEISRLVQHWRLWPKDRPTACPPPASSSPSPRRRGRSRLEVNQHKVPSKDSRFLPPCSTYSIDISQPVAYGFPIFDGKHRQQWNVTAIQREEGETARWFYFAPSSVCRITLRDLP